MTQSQFDFSQARQNMVDNQLRPALVDSSRIVSIMRALPREECVHFSQREFAYMDANIPLKGQRVLSEPRVIARMIQETHVEPLEKVMIIGASTGYVAALFHYLKAEVYAVEETEELAQQGQAFCAKYAPEVKWRVGKLVEGFSEEAPFDVILIDGAIKQLPKLLARQLAPKGRLITVLREDNQASQAILIEHSISDNLRIQPCFYAALPVLSELNVANKDDSAFSLSIAS